jgi:Protein of unknown function (DUF2799)
VNRPTSGLLVFCALLGACAQMSEQECRTTDWYQRGEVDALVYGMRPGIDQYAYQCEKFGVRPDEARYLAGWTEGDRERQARMSRSSGSE